MAGLDWPVWRTAASEERRRVKSVVGILKEGMSAEAGELGMELMWIFGGRGLESSADDAAEGSRSWLVPRTEASRKGLRSKV